MVLVLLIGLFILFRLRRTFLQSRAQMTEQKQGVVCNAIIDCHARTFNSAQSSQLFINCCFAIAFAGMFYVCTEVAHSVTAAKYTDVAKSGEVLYRPWATILWVVLCGNVVFQVWRQYSNYLIPLQFYRSKPESDLEEGLTFLITFVLALFPVFYLISPRLGLLPLMGIIAFNILKIWQMKSAVRRAFAAESQHRKRVLHCLSVFQCRSGIQLLLVVLTLLSVFGENCRVHRLNPYGVRFVLFFGYAPAALYLVYYFGIDRHPADVTEPKKYADTLSDLSRLKRNEK